MSLVICAVRVVPCCFDRDVSMLLSLTPVMETSLHSPHEEVFVNELFSSCCLLQFYQRTMWTM